MLKAIVAFLLVAAVFAHKCIHDDPNLQSLFKKDHIKAHQNYRGFKTQAINSIRVKVFTADLDDPTKHCTAAGQQRPNFGGGTVTCTQEDVLTDAKKKILLDLIIPSALAKLQRYISVDSVVGNLIVPSGACTHFSVDSSHSTTGVADADFVLYVAGGPTSTGTLAWAGTCSTDQNGRPTVGRANFGPAYIEWSDTNPTVNNAQVATAIHEILHALGFSSGGFVQEYITRNVPIRGKTATLYTHPDVVEQYRLQTGCATAQGPEIEDEGSSGSAGSHWDRRVLKDELMAASGGEIFSAMTLAALKATGYYHVDYSVAENHGWGKNGGCGFVNEKCNTVAGGLNKWFCNDASGSTACTWDSKEIGSCYVVKYNSPLPTYFRYFDDVYTGGMEFLDKCPVVHGYSNRKCNVGKTRSQSEKVYGHYFSSISRCFDTVGPLTDSQYVQQGSTHRCLEAKCEQVGSQTPVVHFRVEGYAWIQCTSGTVEVPSSTGYKGSVVCPTDPSTFCEGITTNPAAPATPAPSTPAPFVTLPAPPTPSLAPGETHAPPAVTELPTEKGELIVTAGFKLTGDSWPTLVNDPNSANNLKNTLRTDLSTMIGLPTRRISIIGISSESERLSVSYALVGDTGLEVSALNTTMAKKIGTSAFTKTNELYSSISVVVPVVTTVWIDTKDTTTSVCGSGYTNAECNVIVTGVVTVIVLLGLLAILVLVCCSEGREYIPLPPGSKAPY